MATTRTSSQPSDILVDPSGKLITRAAFFDELSKIAAAGPSENSVKFKKWLKNAALVAAGTGAGTAAVMVLDKLLGDKLGKTWQSVSPKTKMLVVGPLIGLSIAGRATAQQKLENAKSKTT